MTLKIQRIFGSLNPLSFTWTTFRFEDFYIVVNWTEPPDPFTRIYVFSDDSKSSKRKMVLVESQGLLA